MEEEGGGVGESRPSPITLLPSISTSLPQFINTRRNAPNQLPIESFDTTLNNPPFSEVYSTFFMGKQSKALLPPCHLRQYST